MGASDAATAYIVDTHPLVWLLERSPRPSPSAREALSSTSVECVVPSIVLAEVFFLYSRKRIAVGVREVFAHIVNSGNCSVYPLDETVVEHLPATLIIHMTRSLRPRH